MPAHSKGVLIKKDGEETTSGILRARDVEFELRTVELDPRVKSILCRQAEIIHTLGSRLTEAVTQLDQVIDIVQKFADISQNMKDKMDRIQRSVRDVDVEGDPGERTN